MKIIEQSLFFALVLSLVVGIFLAITCGFVATPSWTDVIPMWRLWIPAMVTGIFLGAKFETRRVAVGVSAAIPLFVLAAVGLSGQLPYGYVSDSWPVVWGAYLFSLWTGIYLAPDFS
jgi:hypothetical protein